MASLNIGRAFRFSFDDENWVVKILIGGVISLLSVFLVPIPLLVGYYVEVIERTAREEDVPLPEWGEMGQLFRRGLTVTVGYLIYTLPLVLFVCCLILLTTAAGDGEGVSGLVGVVLLCFYCLVILYSLFIAFWLPAATVRYLETDQLSGMFQFGTIWQFVQRNIGHYLTVIFLSLGASLVATVAGSITCGILSPWTSFWASLVGTHLLGQYWRLYRPPTEPEAVITPAP
ncbi:MAG: DUF4013 domain-containing protein [Ardenticatenia bacterium]|nr:DUF4013 domain-containing protein [Ardenticatenia bacterium]